MKPILPEALLAEYAGDKLDFEPGVRWSYSNTGYTLLGHVVAKVSGKPFGQFLKERILDPLGMTHSAFEPGPEMKGQTKGYTSFALGPLEPAEPEASGWLLRRGWIMGLRPGPRPLGPGLDGGPRVEARVVPRHDHAASRSRADTPRAMAAASMSARSTVRPS